VSVFVIRLRDPWSVDDGLGKGHVCPFAAERVRWLKCGGNLVMQSDGIRP